MPGRARVPVVALNPAESHRRLSQAVNYLDQIMDILYLVNLEQAILAGQAAPTAYNSGQTIVNYQQSLPIDPAAQITADPVAGTITIGVDGWYSVSGYTAGSGQTNNNYYGAAINSVNLGLLYIGVFEWNNANPAGSLIVSGEFKLPLTAGDVISMQAYSNGGTYTINRAILSVEIDSLT